MSLVPPTGADSWSAAFRVAHLTTVDLSLQFLVRPQLIGIRDAGGEAIGISAPGPWVAALESNGIRHIAIESSTRGMSPINDLRAALQLWRVLRSERFTVLHTHNPKPGLYGRVLGRLAGVPLVVNTLHGMYATERDSRLKRGLVYFLEAVASRFSDVELHQNPEDLELSRRYRILPPGKGRLLGNGVDLTRFDPSNVDPDSRKRLRGELGVGDEDIVVGMVGRLVKEKGYLELFEAVSSLEDRYKVWAVGPEDPDKPDSISPGDIADAERSGVRFLGMRTDVEELYSAMDLFVLPSHREGFPRAAMEAAAMGLPVVATNIRGCRQVVDDGVNGILVPVQSPSHLADAIKLLGDDDETRTSMGSASRQIAVERFDERAVVRIVLGTYRDGLIEKGLGHLLPPGMMRRPESGPIRRATVADAGALAALHSAYISTAFLPRLGPRFMRLLYRALIRWDDASVFVTDDSAGLVAFTAGAVDVSAFYRFFIRRYGWAAALTALPRLIRPSTLRKAWESFRYGSGDSGGHAELLSMVVAPRARGAGLALDLGRELLHDLADKGAKTVRVVVGADNDVAIAAYQRMGFARWADIEVHPGRQSEELRWQP